MNMNIGAGVVAIAGPGAKATAAQGAAFGTGAGAGAIIGAGAKPGWLNPTGVGAGGACARWCLARKREASVVIGPVAAIRPQSTARIPLHWPGIALTT